MRTLRTTVKSVAAVALIVAASSVQAGLDFTVNEGSVPGASPNSFVADRIDGTWLQQINFGSPANEVTANGFLDFSTFINNLAPAPIQQLTTAPANPFLPANFYGLYGIYSWAGTLVGTTVTNPVGQITLYIDPLANTGKSPTSTTVNRTNETDDYALGTAPLLLSASVDPANFWDLVYDGFTLTTGDLDPVAAGDQSGETFFTSPDPFHIRIALSSEINAPVTPAPNTSVVIGGAGSAQFVPEPGMLALLGISLVGFGIARRRRKLA